MNRHAARTRAARPAARTAAVARHRSDGSYGIDGFENRQDRRDDVRENRQDYRDDVRDDRQDYGNDILNDRQDFVEDNYWRGRHWGYGTTAYYSDFYDDSCVRVVDDGIHYYRCDDVYFQAYYEGDQVVYVVADVD